MIFRYLYRRKLLRLFGPFMKESDMALLEKQAAEISEWQALKSFLPLRWFHSQDEITIALSKVGRMAEQYSREPEGKPKS